MSRTVYPRSSNPGLGWERDIDVRDFDFPMEAQLAPIMEVPLPRIVMYNTGPILNQGRYPMCVGYSWRQWLTTGTIVNADTDPTARTIYCQARLLDPWQGDCTTDLQSGTSVRAAAKYLQQQRFITNYYWAYHSETIRQWILQGKGPVIVGTPWYQSMFRPVGGRIIVNQRSGLAGGHAYLLSGYNDDTKLFRVTNSWGEGWGQRGNAWLRYADLDLLLAQGEACTALEMVHTGLSEEE